MTGFERLQLELEAARHLENRKLAWMALSILAVFALLSTVLITRSALVWVLDIAAAVGLVVLAFVAIRNDHASLVIHRNSAKAIAAQLGEGAESLVVFPDYGFDKDPTLWMLLVWALVLGVPALLALLG
jgi:hypothetical protein